MLGFGPLGTFPLAGLPPGGISVIGRLDSTIRLGAVINITFVAVGGTAPYTWAATGLPTGLSINASTGVLSGTTTAVGSFTATVTATDSLSATGSTGPMAVAVIALPAYNYDFPNPRGKPWPSDVRTGWTWSSQIPLQSVGAYMRSSKFIAYAVLVPQPFNINQSFDLPPRAPAGRWHHIYRVEQGPSPGLQAAPQFPFIQRSTPDWFPPKVRAGESYSSPLTLTSPKPCGSQSFPERFAPRRRRGESYGSPLCLAPPPSGASGGYVYLIC